MPSACGSAGRAGASWVRLRPKARETGVPAASGSEFSSTAMLTRWSAPAMSCAEAWITSSWSGGAVVDGAPRVACVTPARRVAGREVTTADGLAAEERRAWGDAFCATGASQCGFCSPGIIVRLAALRARDPRSVERALLAHLCRCTGWRTIVDAAEAYGLDQPPRELEAAAARATI